MKNTFLPRRQVRLRVVVILFKSQMAVHFQRLKIIRFGASVNL